MSEYTVLPIGSISPDPDQPRKEGLEDDALSDVVNSIKSIGLFNILLVRPDGSNGYIIVCGERRYRAALQAGLTEVPVRIIKDLDDAQIVEMQLAENMLRLNLSPRDRANAVARFVKMNPDQKTAAAKLGISGTQLTHLLELCSLTPEVSELVQAKVTRDATTLVLANQLMKRAPEAAKEILEQAKESGKLSRKAVQEALAPHRRPRKKKDEAANETSPSAKPDESNQASDTAEPASPSAPASYQGLDESERPVIKAPPRKKLRLVCSMLAIDENTDPAIVIEKIVDSYLNRQAA